MNVSEYRILAIDDQPTNLLLVRRQMERLGVIVDEAISGSQGLACAAERYYPLILVDCEMPVMDGYEFCRQFRLLEREDRRRAAIVALSARDPGEERQRCADAGIDGFIEKPASLVILQALVEKHLSFEGDRREAGNEGFGAAAQVIDWSRFVHILGSDDPSIIREMLTMFRDTVAATIENLMHACRIADRSAAQSLAHRAKGAASNIAAVELSKVLATLEKIAENADPDCLIRLANSANGSFQRVSSAIDARLAA